MVSIFILQSIFCFINIFFIIYYYSLPNPFPLKLDFCFLIIFYRSIQEITQSIYISHPTLYRASSLFFSSSKYRIVVSQISWQKNSPFLRILIYNIKFILFGLIVYFWPIDSALLCSRDQLTVGGYMKPKEIQRL